MMQKAIPSARQPSLLMAAVDGDDEKEKEGRNLEQKFSVKSNERDVTNPKCQEK